MVTLKILGTVCCLYNIIIHSSNHQPWYNCLVRAVIPQLGSYTMGGYKVFVHIVQTTYTIALSWFMYTRGTLLNHSALPHGLNTHLALVSNSNKPLKAIV